MSKKRKAPAGKKRPAKAPGSTSPKVAPQPTPANPEQQQLYRRVFRFSALGILLVTLILSLFSGINGDDEFQNDYSEKLVNYYLSFGA
ncbi:MAG: hypothetical protein KDD06_22005, partial [Phaeodactylibacter sp.]|nr:hypothetical protein [Phaeodactylibacter sp.]